MVAMTDRLRGKRAVVTGAATGIGRASARRFALEGASVVIADRAESELEETRRLIAADGGRVSAMHIDVGVEADVVALFEHIDRELAGLDVLFANAGITGAPLTISETSCEQFQEILRVNLLGPFLAIKYGSPLMTRQGKGSIICTASIAGMRSGAGPIGYSASKAGVINMVQVAANQLRGTGVRVNAICPGIIETGMTKPIFDYARTMGDEHSICQLNPLQRAGQPDEIASAALFLASDDASYITGQALVVDGGFTSSLPFTAPRT
jgi:NAD(P)-dependent dehydrogenase (short-subunit alcohol dehydrogenase family)